MTEADELRDAIDRAIELFEEYAEYLGLSDERFPDMNPQEKQCEFEEQFNAWICSIKGHKIGPDQCGKPEHDYCYRCERLAVDIEAEEKANA